MSTPAPSRGRPLAHLLREKLAASGDRGSLVVAEVTAVPDGQHVTVELGGVTTTIPCLEAYNPNVGDAAYLLVAPALTVALGAVR